MNKNRIGRTFVNENKSPVDQYIPVTFQSTLNLKKRRSTLVGDSVDFNLLSYLYDDSNHFTQFTGLRDVHIWRHRLFHDFPPLPQIDVTYPAPPLPFLKNVISPLKNFSESPLGIHLGMGISLPKLFNGCDYIYPQIFFFNVDTKFWEINWRKFVLLKFI
jgi:hypothetical protein